MQSNSNVEFILNLNFPLWFRPCKNIWPHQETDIKEWWPYAQKVLKYFIDEVEAFKCQQIFGQKGTENAIGETQYCA